MEENKMKKLLALTLAVMMLFTLVACATEEPAESSAPAASSTPATESSTAPESSEEESSEEPAPESSEEPAPESSEEESSEEPEPEEPVENPYEELEIGKATTAPVVDGKVEDGEYATIIEYDELDFHWANGAIGEGLDVYETVVYLSWDEEYLYTCVEVMVGNPRTYDNTDFTANRPYIFDRRHLMSAIVLGDPCMPKYQPADGESWAWGDAYNSGLGTEWSISAQPDGTPIKADHFGALTTNADFQYVIGVSGYDKEYYEQRIPWSALQGGASFTAEAGVKIGYAFTCCPEEVDISEGADGSNDKYICFGAGITGYKNFGEYVGMTLVD
jgi:hypothetical protein